MEKQHRHSKKREAIRGLLAGTREHPSAEWIYTRLKPDFPDLSLGTVYRNLHLFREEGQILCVGTVAGQDRFDFDTSPHAHFICEHCGRVIDVDTPENGAALLPASLPGEPRSFALNFFGCCRTCLKIREDESP